MSFAIMFSTSVRQTRTGREELGVAETCRSRKIAKVVPRLHSLRLANIELQTQAVD
jgi:hypothetical protein